MKCRKCRRKVKRSGNWVRLHLFGAFADFHVPCFRSYLHNDASDELERVAWRTDRTVHSTAPAKVATRGERYQDESE